MRHGVHQKRRFRLFLPGLIATFLILFVFIYGTFESGLHLVQRPLVAVGTWIYQKTSLFENASKRIHELEIAQNQLQQLAVDHVLLESLKKENKELKDALQFVERTGIQSIPTSIVSRSSLEGGTVLRIDIGTQDGAAIGNPVIVGDGMLIGKIVEITNASATVKSITHPDLATAVSILGQSQTIGVAEGISGNLMRLKFIPQDSQIKLNDLVVTSGLESQIPAGLFIGLVNDVRSETNAPFLEAVIEPLVDVRQYHIVHVLIQEQL